MPSIIVLGLRKLIVTAQRCFGKGFDESCPIGPVLVRTSETDPDNLDLQGKLSEEVMQESNTS